MVALVGIQVSGDDAKLKNRQIDFDGFLNLSAGLNTVRERQLVPLDKFLQMAGEPNTIILDTRSRAMFERKHLKGAVLLNFSDITKGALEKAIPSKTTRILIYCNNNFSNNSPAFASKSFTTALNIPTFITLYSYGYRNLYELGPVEDESNTILEFEGSDVK